MSDRTGKQLFLSTVAFAIAFAVWGCLGGAAPLLKNILGLTPFETSVMVATPIVLGSVGRIPMGFLTDRLGARLVMSGTLTFSGLCALAIAWLDLNYYGLLFLGALMGISGTAFAIGVVHISGWFPKDRQGSALGIFGLGNIGQSMAVFGIPFLTPMGSWKTGFILFGLLSIGWAVVYWFQAKESPLPVGSQQSLEGIWQLFVGSYVVRILSMYYFLTFGGFVALSVYLPTLLKNEFSLAPQDAGTRTAIFVILATLMRPLGGYFADRWGAVRILFFVFLGLTCSPFLFMVGKLELFSLGLAGFAISAGIGNGAVFKLVVHYFPKSMGTVSGLVGAAGGMGGFFLPLLMGFSWQHYGHYFVGWMGLSIFSSICILICWKMTSNEKRRASSIAAKGEIAIS